MIMLQEILSSFSEPNFWHWFIAAVVFFVFELLLPTMFLMWAGIGAFVTGVIVLALPETEWTVQLVLFAVLSVVSTIAGKKWLKKRPIATDEPLLNRRGEQYLGRIVTLAEPIVNGVGHVSLDDTRWKVKGPDLDKGDQVRISAMSGSSMIVEHAPKH